MAVATASHSDWGISTESVSFLEVRRSNDRPMICFNVTTFDIQEASWGLLDASCVQGNLNLVRNMQLSASI